MFAVDYLCVPYVGEGEGLYIEALGGGGGAHCGMRNIFFKFSLPRPAVRQEAKDSSSDSAADCHTDWDVWCMRGTETGTERGTAVYFDRRVIEGNAAYSSSAV